MMGSGQVFRGRALPDGGEVAGHGAAGNTAGGSQAYLGPRARHVRVLAPGDMMIDRCDVRSHVVSESVEGGWLMPGT